MKVQINILIYFIILILFFTRLTCFEKNHPDRPNPLKHEEKNDYGTYALGLY